MKGTHWMITGGAGGIGRCIAQFAAKAGANLSILDRDEEAGRDTVQRLERLGVRARLTVGDAAEKESLERFARESVTQLGPVHALIHNACFSMGGLASGCGWDEFNQVLQAGVTAPYYLTYLVMEHFVPWASVINISSTRAFMSQADTESYSAAKGGITALTHAMAMSLAGRARVNAIAPGWIDTGAYHGDGGPAPHSWADESQHPSGRGGTPEDIARAAIFLCDPANRFINGETLVVDGGMTRKMIYDGDEGWSLNP